MMCILKNFFNKRYAKVYPERMNTIIVPTKE
jgi:hypothetical protein